MLCPSLATQGQVIATEIYKSSDNFDLAMLCTNLATQGQVIDESTKGLAFAFQADRGEYKNIGANAKPLQVYVYRALRARITDDTNSKERRFYGYSLGFSSSRT